MKNYARREKLGSVLKCIGAGATVVSPHLPFLEPGVNPLSSGVAKVQESLSGRRRVLAKALLK